MKNETAQENLLDKSKNYQEWLFSPESLKSIRTTLKIKPNTYEEINGAGTMSKRINYLIHWFMLTLGNEISTEDFAFLEPLLQKDREINIAIEESVKIFHSLGEKNNTNAFYGRIIHDAFFEERSFIETMQKNVFDRKNLITKTLVMSSLAKKCIDLFSKGLGMDKSTAFDFIINISYQLDEGKKIRKAKRHHKPYKAILEKLHKLQDYFIETEKEIRKILKDLGMDEYDIDELFGLDWQISANYEEVDPIEAALGTFDTIKTILESDVSYPVKYAVDKCEKILNKEVGNEDI